MNDIWAWVRLQEPNSMVVSIKNGIEGSKEHLSQSPLIFLIGSNTNHTVILSIDFELQDVIIRSEGNFNVLLNSINKLAKELKSQIG